ncbi:hypothetical protein FA95DRAFT_1221318 [Auriscalpium vulgare]|uniref:Uncharacterized protein n=1 Tax=Auriscalpium vulgare TaxID=40419 RepID=A0ACB8R3I0_9AGAM|nr:hypothetical protein FA95DRAFT_1221318 [Auriscalpium vulgare]
MACGEDVAVGPYSRLETLLEVLRMQPQLEMLSLRQMELEPVAEELDAEKCTRQGIAFPRLQKVVVAGDYMDLGLIFRHLALPVSVDLHTDCNVRYSQLDPILPDMCVPIGAMLYSALAGADAEGLSFQDVEVRVGRNRRIGTAFLHIIGTNPRPLPVRAGDADAEASAPKTKMHLTMRHRHQEWMAEEFMGLLAAMLIKVVPGIDGPIALSTEGIR